MLCNLPKSTTDARVRRSSQDVEAISMTSLSPGRATGSKHADILLYHSSTFHQFKEEISLEISSGHGAAHFFMWP